MEEELREIEKKIDNYHKDFPIFNEDRDTALFHILLAFEDMCRLAALPIMATGGNMNVFINNNADCLDMGVKWIYNCCNIDLAKRKNDIDMDLYMQAGIMLIEAGNYRKICDAYTLWSRGRQTAEVSSDGKSVIFDYLINNSGEIEAFDYIRGDKKKSQFMHDSSFNFEVEKMVSIKENLKRITKLDSTGRIEYDIPDLVWNEVSTISKNIMNQTSELPDDWRFKYFSLGEYKRFWEVILTLSFIHSIVCFEAGGEGAGLKSCLITRTYDQLEQQIHRYSSLEPSIIKNIIKFITYSPSRKNIDILWQPLIKMDDSSYVISPNLVMISSPERNIISLINKIDQASYSRISSKKEEIMILQMEINVNKYSNLIVATSRPLPEPLPDMDFIIYDKENSTLLIAELKWLIATDSIQEVCARDEDIAKGISQAQIILNYANTDINDLLNRAFGRTDYKIEKILTCVITRNNVGTSQLGQSISVIDETNFFRLMEESEGNLKQVISIIERKDYYPKINEDYRIKKLNVEYSGYSFEVDGIESINSSTDNDEGNTVGNFVDMFGNNVPDYLKDFSLNANGLDTIGNGGKSYRKKQKQKRKVIKKSRKTNRKK